MTSPRAEIPRDSTDRPALLPFGAEQPIAVVAELEGEPVDIGVQFVEVVAVLATGRPTVRPVCRTEPSSTRRRVPALAWAEAGG